MEGGEGEGGAKRSSGRRKGATCLVITEVPFQTSKVRSRPHCLYSLHHLCCAACLGRYCKAWTVLRSPANLSNVLIALSCCCNVPCACAG